MIWTAADIAAVKAIASPEVGHVIDLAVHTGLRAGDLVRLSWSHIGPNVIRIPTEKSGRALEAIVPLYGALRAVLASIPKRSTVVLTNTHGKPWDAVNGSSFTKARNKALPGKDLRFHDLRGTAATNFYRAGLKPADIAEIMAWEPSRVEKIIRRYVGREAFTAAIIDQLDQIERRT